VAEVKNGDRPTGTIPGRKKEEKKEVERNLGMGGRGERLRNSEKRGGEKNFASFYDAFNFFGGGVKRGSGGERGNVKGKMGKWQEAIHKRFRVEGRKRHRSMTSKARDLSARNCYRRGGLEIMWFPKGMGVAPLQETSRIAKREAADRRGGGSKVGSRGLGDPSS